MRIAYFSPLNPQPTGVADYSEELLPHLAHHAALDLFVNGYRPSNLATVEQFEVFDCRRFPELQRQRRYDAYLYHMGNSPLHRYIYDTLLCYPGVTVLHDYVLYDLFRSTTLGRREPAAYAREMGYCYSWRGIELAHQAMHNERAFPGHRYPLVDRVIDASLGLIVHTDYIRRQIVRTHPNVPIAKINHHLSLKMWKPFPPDPHRVRASLGLNDGQFVVASFGQIAPNRRTDVVLRALRRLRRELPTAVYLLVGAVIPTYDIQKSIRRLGLEDAVILTGRVDPDAFQRYMAAADVCLNLRYPTAGEMSGSLIRMMGTGRPVLISDVDAFQELPDDCCAKVPVGPGEEDAILARLLALARDPTLRQRMGACARRHVEIHHRVEDAAGAYARFIEECLAATSHPDWPTHRLAMYHPPGQKGWGS